jgi:2,4-dienoyl-CoA reductase-like NADH-dependent reductase (Old Yellow Enzyme family)
MNILLTPVRIGPVEIKNRIVMPPMTTRTADAEGFVTDDSVAYYMARVRGGTGLITVEMASPEKCGRHRRHEVGIYDDRFLPGLTRLVGEIHRGGAKASIQLGHGGGHTRIDICGETPIAPSAIPHPVYETTFETIVPEEMTKPRIAQTIAAHVAAALRAQKAGFDCPRLPDLAIPRAVRKPAHGRLWRQPGKPGALRARDLARREGGGAGHRRDLPPLGGGFLSRRPAV